MKTYITRLLYSSIVIYGVLFTIQPVFSSTIPLPASAHSYPFLGTTRSMNTEFTKTSTSTEKILTIATHAGPTTSKQSSNVEPSQAILDAIVQENASLSEEAYIDPYALERQYNITKNVNTIPKNRYIASSSQPPKGTTKKVIRKTVQPATIAQIPKNIANDKDLSPDPTLWQSSHYKFTPERNIIVYPENSPLKMITLQYFVEISDGPSVAKKARLLLDRINTALPNAVLIAGLRELSDTEPLYTLSQWNRVAFQKAIQKVSSRIQKENIGSAIEKTRQYLLNIQAPATLLLITDGEDYNSENLQFDLKLFYAPDPRFPLYIISFATSKAEKRTIQLIKNVHRGSLIFDGNELLNDSAKFTEFMKRILVK